MREIRVENKIVDGKYYVTMFYKFLKFGNYLLNSFESKTARKVKPKFIGEN